MRVREREVTVKNQRNLREMVKFRKHRLWEEMKETDKQKMWLRILCKINSGRKKKS